MQNLRRNFIFSLGQHSYAAHVILNVSMRSATVFFCANLGGSNLLWAAASQTESYRTHTHLAIPVDPSLTYDVVTFPAGKGFSLKIHSLFSQDTKRVLGSFRALKDARTSRVDVKEEKENGEWTVDVFFKEAAGVSYEVFDYRDKNTSTVFIDYWAAAPLSDLSKVAASSPMPPRQSANKALAKGSANKGSVKSLRSIASGPVAIHGPVEIASFCDRPLSSKQDAVLNFKVYHRAFNYESHFDLATPDAKYHYPVAEDLRKKTEGEDAQSDRAHYILATKLYREDRLGLTLKTVEFFEKKFGKAEPVSPFLSEMKFLKANALFKLSQKLNSEHFRQESFSLLNLILLKEPESVHGQFARLFLLQDLIKNHKNVQALEAALSGANLKDKYETVYLLAAAESMQSIGEKGRAEELYGKIMASGHKDRLAIEGAFRLGEVHMLAGDFEQARKTFTTSLRDYPERIDDYPTAVFNHAETYFRLGKLKEAREMHQEFIKRFPHDEMIWASLLRVAELTHELKDGKVAGSTIVANYQDVVNKLPYTTGAFLASVRLSDCVRIKGDDDLGRKNLAFYRGLFEKKELAKQESALLNPLDLRKFVDLYELRFRRRLGDFDYVLKMARQYRSRLEGDPIHLSLKAELSGGVEDFILKLINSPEAQDGDYSRALKLVSLYKDYLPSVPSAAFQLALARAHFEVGDYRKTSQLLGVILSDEGKLDNGLKDDAYWLNYEILRRTSVDPAAIQAALLRLSPQGLYAAERFYLNLELLGEQKKFKQILDASTDQGMAGFSDETKTKTQLLRLRALWELGDAAGTLKESDQLILTRGLTAAAEEFMPEVNKLRAQAIYKLKKFDSAIVALSEVLDQMKKTEPKDKAMAAFEFMLARSLDAVGREKEAEDSFRKLASSDQGIWGKSAKVEIEQKQFKKNQSKELNRE